MVPKQQSPHQIRTATSHPIPFHPISHPIIPTCNNRLVPSPNQRPYRKRCSHLSAPTANQWHPLDRCLERFDSLRWPWHYCLEVESKTWVTRIASSGGKNEYYFMSMICFLFKDFEILITWEETEAVFLLLVPFWKQFQGESGRKWKVRAIFSEIQVMTIPLTLSSMNMTSFLGCVWWICLHLSHRWNDIQGKGQLVHVVFEVMVIERFHLSSPAQTVARRSHQQSLLTLSKAVFWLF